MNLSQHGPGLSPINSQIAGCVVKDTTTIILSTSLGGPVDQPLIHLSTISCTPEWHLQLIRRTSPVHFVSFVQRKPGVGGCLELP